MRKLLFVLCLTLTGCQTTVHYVGQDTELNVENSPPKVDMALAWNLPTFQEFPFEIVTMRMRVNK